VPDLLVHLPVDQRRQDVPLLRRHRPLTGQTTKEDTTMAKLTCTNCGNDKGWRNARQDANGNQTATCTRCGTTVRTTGGTRMDTVTDMRQDR
jgi:predicted RNA-binding Zn-ribbon protein involved in translation (DUF1610 family)